MLEKKKKNVITIGGTKTVYFGCKLFTIDAIIVIMIKLDPHGSTPIIYIQYKV